MQLKFTPFPTLNTDRLVLRRLKESDQEDIFHLRTDEIVNKFIARVKPKTLDGALTFIKKINSAIDDNKSIYWVISLKDDPKLIGTICLWNFSVDNSEAEIGYELNVSWHGKGIMNEAMERVLSYGFQDLALTRIEAFTDGANADSIKLLDKNGFKIVPGKIDEDNINNVIYSLSR